MDGAAGIASERRWEDDRANGQELPGRGALFVERASCRSMLFHQFAWADLAARAIDTNVFLEPAFALPLLQHVAQADRPEFLLAWEQNTPTSFGRLVGLMPLSGRRLLPMARYVLHGFAHKQTSVGTPLLDRDNPDAVFTAMTAWLRRNEPQAVGLRLHGLSLESPFHEVLRRTHAGGLFRLREYKRAVLRHADPDLAPKVACFMSAKRRKEIGRQRRRLAEIGHRSYKSAHTPTDVASATERFLRLEDKGWKGQRGTALLASPSLATFTRSMTRLMAFEGKCRIDSIEIDGKAVAMGIILMSGRRAYFWKTAFDETYAPLSPGVQFAQDFTQAQLAETNIDLTDSCAIPDHPMIDRVWCDRMVIADVIINLRPDASKQFAVVCCLAHFGNTARDAAKRLFKQLRRKRGVRFRPRSERPF